jgi:energy-coupling factor transporter ATP-binding protein EcfA2
VQRIVIFGREVRCVKYSNKCDYAIKKNQGDTIQKPKIICITGYSGSGKTTMIKLMQEYLPNSHSIYRDGNKEMLKIQNPEEFEKKYGVPVNTNDVIEYFREVASFVTNTDFANADTDVAFVKKYLELVTIYFEIKYEEILADILTKTTPQFVILDWLTLPLFKIWNKADYRIMVKPAKWDLLVENVRKRESAYPVTSDIAKARYLATREIIEGAENITHVVLNHFDDEYEQIIKNLCVEFMVDINIDLLQKNKVG